MAGRQPFALCYTLEGNEASSNDSSVVRAFYTIGSIFQAAAEGRQRDNNASTLLSAHHGAGQSWTCQVTGRILVRKLMLRGLARKCSLFSFTTTPWFDPSIIRHSGLWLSGGRWSSVGQISLFMSFLPFNLQHQSCLSKAIGLRILKHMSTKSFLASQKQKRN
jgi:hypothetical protein